VCDGRQEIDDLFRVHRRSLVSVDAAPSHGPDSNYFARFTQ
jgi:hypothetical protein